MCWKLSATNSASARYSRPQAAARCAVAAVGHQAGQVAQVGDGLGVVHVLGGDARRAARAGAFQRRVHELVLVLQMHLAQAEQALELAQRGGHLAGIAGIGAADAAQRAAHEQAQRLVDAGVQVEPAQRSAVAAACDRREVGGAFGGVRVHRVPLRCGVAAGCFRRRATTVGTASPGRS